MSRSAFQSAAAQETALLYGSNDVALLLVNAIEELKFLGLNTTEEPNRFATKASVIIEGAWEVGNSTFSETMSLLIDKERPLWVKEKDELDLEKIEHAKLKVLAKTFQRLGFRVRTRQACLDYTNADKSLWQLQVLVMEDAENNLQAILSKDCN